MKNYFKGFTLIETLITSLIAFVILAGVLVSYNYVFQRFKRSQREMKDTLSTSIAVNYLQRSIMRSSGVDRISPNFSEHIRVYFPDGSYCEYKLVNNDQLQLAKYDSAGNRMSEEILCSNIETLEFWDREDFTKKNNTDIHLLGINLVVSSPEGKDAALTALATGVYARFADTPKGPAYVYNETQKILYSDIQTASDEANDNETLWLSGDDPTTSKDEGLFELDTRVTLNKSLIIQGGYKFVFDTPGVIGSFNEEATKGTRDEDGDGNWIKDGDKNPNNDYFTKIKGQAFLITDFDTPKDFSFDGIFFSGPSSGIRFDYNKKDDGKFAEAEFSVIVAYCSFSESAIAGGSPIHKDAAGIKILDIKHCEFLNPHSSAIYMMGHAKEINIEDCYFFSNENADAGVLSTHETKISDCEFIGFKTAVHIISDIAKGFIRNCTFRDNDTAIELFGSSSCPNWLDSEALRIPIENCSFIGNSDTVIRQYLCVWSKIVDCLFENNTGTLVESWPFHNERAIRFSHCIFKNNSSSGSIFDIKYLDKMEYCSFINNSVAEIEKPLLFLKGSDAAPGANVFHCIFYNNSTNDAAIIMGSDFVVVSDSIFYNNTPIDINGSKTFLLYYSAYENIIGVTLDGTSVVLSADPFTDSMNNDFSLSDGSPAIDIRPADNWDGDPAHYHSEADGFPPPYYDDSWDPEVIPSPEFKCSYSKGDPEQLFDEDIDTGDLDGDTIIPEKAGRSGDAGIYGGPGGCDWPQK